MMFFFKKHRHKKHKKNKENCINTSGSLKVKKHFGLTANEMDELILQISLKPKIPIVNVS